MRDLEFDEFVPSLWFGNIDESVDGRNVYYRLSESEIFKIANEKAPIKGLPLTDVIPRMLVDNQGFAHISYDMLDKELVYELFEGNRFNITCKKTIRELIQKEKIVMVYSEEYKLPTSIPFVIKGNSSTDRSIYVNISDFVSMDQYGNVLVTQNRNYYGLMAILFSAAIAFEIASGRTLVAQSMDALVVMYGSMMEKTINAIAHMDQNTKDRVRYLSIQFALIQMFGTSRGTELFERIKTKYVPSISSLVADAIDASFLLDNFDNLELFLESLRKTFPILKKITLTNVFEKWIKLYGSSTALSIDYLGYHIYTFSMLMFESPLISRIALESTINPLLGSNAYKAFQNMMV